jgi:hypothetical protein
MTLTTNRPLLRSGGSVRLAVSTHTSTTGGSAETPQTDVAVNPLGVPSSSRVVTIATPEGAATP